MPTPSLRQRPPAFWEGRGAGGAPDDARPRGDGSHGFSIEADVVTGRCRAVCSCGWHTQTFGSAGLAGAAWDEHNELGHDERRTAPPRRRANRPGAEGRRAYDQPS